MFIPANFAIGALVGAAASYVYKDEAARETISNLGSKVKGGLDSTLGMFKKNPEAEAAEEVAADNVETVEQAAADVVTDDVDVAGEEKQAKA